MASIAWGEVHHIALVTRDLEATRTFYERIVDMHSGPIHPAAHGRGRHCFIAPRQAASHGLHFFEHPSAQLPLPPNTVRDYFTNPHPQRRLAYLPGTLQHIAFALMEASAADSLQRRLQANDVPYVGPFTQGDISNLMFSDNNGILIEAAWSARSAGDAAASPRCAGHLITQPVRPPDPAGRDRPRRERLLVVG